MGIRTAIAAIALSYAPLAPSFADDAAVARGKYLVTLGGCQDCHTPGHFFGKPDMARALGGSEVGFEIPGLGTFYGPNLTPDKETGLGGWTDAEIMTAFQTGTRPDGRLLAPLTRDDAQSVVAYLRSLPPVATRGPGAGTFSNILLAQGAGQQ